MVSVKEIIETLTKMGKKKNIPGMARFGINPENNLGVSVTDIRKYSRSLGHNHELALKLWKTGIRDARMVAACIEEPEKISSEQMDDWVKDFNSWDLCDHVCGHCFDKTRFSYEKAIEWSKREEEFVKRAGFALMAWLAVHDKKQKDSVFADFLPIIQRESFDDRNYVKKAVNWALRNIGKRNLILNKQALATAHLLKKETKSTARWIGSDAARELQSEKVQHRLQKKEMNNRT